MFGGGGGTIMPRDAARIEAAGVAKIYGPDWSLDSIAEDMTGRIAGAHRKTTRPSHDQVWDKQSRYRTEVLVY